MAVTKIRKISSWTLLGVLAVSLVVCLVFFFGGSELDLNGNKEYHNTGLLLNWMYVLSGIVIIVAILFSVLGFFHSFKTDRKRALTGLAMLVALIVLMVVTYAIGNGTPLTSVGEDAQKYNVAKWLKVADMSIFTIYVLGALTVLAVCWNGLRSVISKK